jgi:hypothetical protein
VRLVALVLLLGLWLLPWAEVQTPQGDTVRPRWAEHTGVVGGLALVALWGACATSLLATTRRGRRLGAALTDAAVAFATTGLLAVLHAWIPGGAHRETWVPIFAPLGILAALDAFVVAARREAGGEITFLRAAAALFAAAALVVKAEWVPAGIAAWLGASALAFGLGKAPGAARRALETQVLLAGCFAILSPVLHAAVFGEVTPVREYPFVRWGWTLLALGVAATGAFALAGPSSARADAPAA